jgi:septum formation protein
VTRIVLASKSAPRAALLAGAGVAFETQGSGVDEEPLKVGWLAEGAAPRVIARRLAAAKAQAVSRLAPDALVIGADQTLELDGALYDKVDSLAAARERLLLLRGREHELHSALVVARAGRVIWRFCESPKLTFRAFSDAWLDDYLARVGDALLGSVGCYMYEAEGAQLVERIYGDYFAVLGLPLLPLLQALRQGGAMIE